MSRIFAKFTGLFLVLALIVAGNHCTLEDLLGDAIGVRGRDVTEVLPLIAKDIDGRGELRLHSTWPIR